MNKLIMSLMVLIIMSVIVGASGQLLLKRGLNELGEINFKVGTLPSTIFKIITNKFIFIGLSFFVVGAFLWMSALSKINLSIGYPIFSGSLYISVIILSAIFLKENINYLQFVGIFVTLLGIIILTRSGH